MMVLNYLLNYFRYYSTFTLTIYITLFSYVHKDNLRIFLQQSAGIFSYLKNNIMLSIQQEPTPDMSPETLEALSLIMLAQAQEIFTYKAIHDNMKDLIIARLAAQTEEFYTDALKLLQKEIFRAFWDKDWIPLVSVET